MTFRQALYAKIPVWLGYITADNGYTNTLRSSFKGVVPQSAANEDLSCWYVLAADKPVNTSEDDMAMTRECSLFIGISFKADSEEGALIEKYESLVSDILKWLYRGANAGKWFAPDSEMTSELVDYGGAVDNGIEPVMSFKESAGELVIEIIVQYSLDV